MQAEAPVTPGAPGHPTRDAPGHGPIRTYKLRRGRVTAAQAAALERLWGGLGVEVDGRALDLPALFGRTAPVVLEIGSGMGETTAVMAAADPARDLLAVDVHTPGLGNLLRLVDRAGLANVRVAAGDAVVLLRDMLPPDSLAEVRVFFPDPWPKSRHAKRRLLQPAFVDLLTRRLEPGGTLHVATDSASYAAQTLAVLGGHPRLRSDHDGCAPRPEHRPVTRFESQGLTAGRSVFDIVVSRRER